MKKTLFTVLLTVLFSLVVSPIGMQAQSISKQINDIKRDSTYLCAENTDETEAKALAVAQELLEKQIEEFVAEQRHLRRAANVIVKDVANAAERLKMSRGQMVRVFLYVKKTDIIAANNTLILVQPSNTSQQASGRITATTGTFVADSSSAATNKEATQAIPTTQNEVLQDSTIEDSSPDSIASPNPSGTSQGFSMIPWQQDVVNSLLKCNTATQVRQLLARLRVETKVRRYGNPNECRKPEEAFFVILNEEGKVQTILGPVVGELRMNFCTNKFETLSNYRGFGGIWFTLRD